MTCLTLFVDDHNKICFYVPLFVSLAESDLDHDTRLHFIQMVRTLHSFRSAMPASVCCVICCLAAMSSALLALTILLYEGKSLQALNALINWRLLKAVPYSFRRISSRHHYLNPRWTWKRCSGFLCSSSLKLRHCNNELRTSSPRSKQTVRFDSVLPDKSVRSSLS
jgi:hypothetical protein